MADKDFYDIKGLGELPSEQTAEHPASPYRPARSSKKSKFTTKNLLIIVGVVVLLAIIGGGAFWYLKHHKKTTTAKAPVASSTTTTPAVAPSAKATTSSTTSHYVSNGQDLNLEFDYPADWTATPATNSNPKDGTITVDSPSVPIPDASGASTTGKAEITIRPGTANLSELGAGTPTAAQPSLQIAYTKPTAAQHQYTYLTFIHFTTGSAVPGAFEEVLVTGVQSFKKGDAVTTTALTGIDPIIAVNFYRCATSDCAAKGAGPLSISNDTWTNNAFVKQIQTVFASLKLH